MTDVSRYDPDAESEGQRLRADERRMQDDELQERADMSLNPEEAWVRANIREATAQIVALQQALKRMAPDWHYFTMEGNSTLAASHGYESFEDCPNAKCRKLRDQLAQIPRIESGTYAP